MANWSMLISPTLLSLGAFMVTTIDYAFIRRFLLWERNYRTITCLELCPGFSFVFPLIQFSSMGTTRQMAGWYSIYVFLRKNAEGGESLLRTSHPSSSFLAAFTSFRWRLRSCANAVVGIVVQASLMGPSNVKTCGALTVTHTIHLQMPHEFRFRDT